MSILSTFNSLSARGVGWWLRTAIIDAKITSSSTGSTNAAFGYGIDMNGIGDIVIVGEMGNDTGGADRGAAYVFKFENNTWLQKQELFPSDPSNSAYFGRTVSINSTGDIIAVSAPLKSNGGKVYIFQYDGTSYVETHSIVSNDIAAGDSFGDGMTLNDSGNRLIVGAPGKFSGTGAVYIFDYNGTSWIQSQKIVAADGAADDYFGRDIAITSTNITMIIGASRDDITGTNQGSAYIYNLVGSTWTFQTKLIASDGATNNFFGNKVDIDAAGTRAIVGAVGNSLNNGAVYVYDYNGTTWTQKQKITATPVIGTGRFGSGVAISNSGSRIICGSDGTDYSGIDAGSVYYFDYNGTSFVQTGVLSPTNIAAGAQLGQDVACNDNGGVFIAGAIFDTINSVPNKGSAFIFVR